MACQNAQTFVALEATPGTEETPDAGEVILAESTTFSFAGGGPQARAGVRANYGGLKPTTPAGRWWEGEIVAEVKASASAGAAPELGNCFKAMGFGATEDPGVSWTYALLDDPNSAAYDASVTIDLEQFEDGNTYTSFGARMGLTLDFATDSKLMATMPFLGAYKAVAAQGALTSPTYNTGTPLVNLSDTTPFQIDTGGDQYNAEIRSGSIALNITPTFRPHMGGTLANGYGKWPAWLSRGENVGWEFVITAEDESSWLAWTNLIAAQAMVIEMNFAAGSRGLEILLRDSVLQNISESQETPNTYTITGTSAHDGTNGPLQLTFT